MRKTGRGILNNSDRREAMRVFLLRRDGRNCAWCGIRMAWNTAHDGRVRADAMTFDHLVRRRDSGGSRRENLVLACSFCNKQRD